MGLFGAGQGGGVDYDWGFMNCWAIILVGRCGTVGVVGVGMAVDGSGSVVRVRGSQGV